MLELWMRCLAKNTIKYIQCVTPSCYSNNFSSTRAGALIMRSMSASL